MDKQQHDGLRFQSVKRYEERVERYEERLRKMAERLATGEIGTDQCEYVIDGVRVLSAAYRDTRAELARVMDDLIEAQRQLSRANDRADMYLLKIIRAKETLS